MAEKISESLWKAFTKKHKLELDDKDLLKALARFDKTDEHKPEPRLEALQELAKEVPKQVVALVKRKKELGDKTFGLIKDELYALLEEAETLQKATKASKDKDEEGEEDEDSAASALVNPKVLLRQLTLCRQDPERTVKFAFVDGNGKDQPAMLAVHPRMSARTLFTKLQVAAGVKTGAYGSAWVDGTSLMLQLDKPLSGLVKKVRPAVKASGFKIAKAVIWNADGTVFEQDDLPDEAAVDAAAQPAALGAPGTPGEPTLAAGPTAPPQPSAIYEAKRAALLPQVTKASANGSGNAAKLQRLLEFASGKAESKDFLGAVAALKQIEQLLADPTVASLTSATSDKNGKVEVGVAFKARMLALIPAMKEARAAGRPNALEASSKATEAGMAAGKGDFARAQALLDEAEALLAGQSAVSNADSAEPTLSDEPAKNEGAVTPGEPPKGVVAFQASRIMWIDVRKRMLSETQRLADRIIAQSADDSDADDIRAAAGDIVNSVGTIDERLQKVLENITVSPEGNEREALKRQAMGVIDDYRTTLATGIFKTIDANPVLAVAVAEPARAALAAISRALA